MSALARTGFTSCGQISHSPARLFEWRGQKVAPPPQAKASKRTCIFVFHNATGEKLPLYPILTDTLQTVKEEVSKLVTIPASHLRLSWRGMILEESRTLVSYGIGHDCCLHFSCTRSGIDDNDGQPSPRRLMPLTVNMVDDSDRPMVARLRVLARIYDKVLEVKLLLEAQTGIPAGDMRLTMGGKTLPNESSLIECGVRDDTATLQLICVFGTQDMTAVALQRNQRLAVAGSDIVGLEFMVTVKEIWPAGRCHRLGLTADTQIRVLKEQVAKCSGIQAEKQMLLHRGRALQDDLTASYYNLESGAFLDLAVVGGVKPTASVAQQSTSDGGASSSIASPIAKRTSAYIDDWNPRVDRRYGATGSVLNVRVRQLEYDIGIDLAGEEANAPYGHVNTSASVPDPDECPPSPREKEKMAEVVKLWSEKTPKSHTTSTLEPQDRDMNDVDQAEAIASAPHAPVASEESEPQDGVAPEAPLESQHTAIDVSADTLLSEVVPPGDENREQTAELVESSELDQAAPSQTPTEHATEDIVPPASDQASDENGLLPRDTASQAEKDDGETGEDKLGEPEAELIELAPTTLPEGNTEVGAAEAADGGMAESDVEAQLVKVPSSTDVACELSVEEASTQLPSVFDAVGQSSIDDDAAGISVDAFQDTDAPLEADVSSPAAGVAEADTGAPLKTEVEDATLQSSHDVAEAVDSYELDAAEDSTQQHE